MHSDHQDLEAGIDWSETILMFSALAFLAIVVLFVLNS